MRKRARRDGPTYSYRNRVPHYSFEHSDGRKMRFYGAGMGFDCVQISSTGQQQRVYIQEGAVSSFMSSLEQHGWQQVSARSSVG